MARERIIAACVVVVGVLVASVATAQAAPALQGETPLPAPTGDVTQPSSTTDQPARLGTVTPIIGTPGLIRPTPTLLPPPSSGGRVAVEALYVRDEPSFSGDVIAIIPYGQSVYPVGRNSDSSWIAINWGSARTWVYAEMVSWDSALDLDSLPVLVDSTGESPPATAGGSPTPVQTTTVAPTLTPVPSVTQAGAASATSTRAVAAVPTVIQPATSVPAAPATAIPASPAPPVANVSIPGSVQTPIFIVLAVVVVAGLVYFWQWSAARAEVKRYAKGFVLSICPVCQEGHIHLDEVARTTAGINLVRRSARCDTCNSVLRELRPGVWRYSVDAYANPELAERFKTRPVTTAELQELARNIVLRPGTRLFDEPTAESLDLAWLEIEEPLGDVEPEPEAPAEDQADADKEEDASQEEEESAD